MTGNAPSLSAALAERFGDAGPVPPQLAANEALKTMAMRGSTRDFDGLAVADELLYALCALALASPTKSDLQQRDIVIVRDRALHNALAALMPGQAWGARAPALLVFCGNNRRQRQLHEWRGRPFANDHLDAFFNAAVDAAIALSAFVAAAALCGLGTCPVSAIRNEAQKVSDLLRLPPHVFPVAGLAVGWPAQPPAIALRLPLAATVHVDSFSDADIAAQIEAYDRRRAKAQPYAGQRFVADFGRTGDYGWSEDKARQYAKPERETFGAFVRARGFRLD
ncbi:MAG: nitroreductase family protein [Pseudorhodoplanes sp.]|nr:nitroreductase family protein [Pseudorhodoplanes sp.]